METFSLIIEIIIVTLLLAAAITIIKYPKDVIRGFFNCFKPSLGEYRSWIFLPFWLIGKLIEVTTKLKIYEED